MRKDSNGKKKVLEDFDRYFFLKSQSIAKNYAINFVLSVPFYQVEGVVFCDFLLLS